MYTDFWDYFSDTQTWLQIKKPFIVLVTKVKKHQTCDIDTWRFFLSVIYQKTMTLWLRLIIMSDKVKVKSAHEPSGPSGRSLSQLIPVSLAESISSSPWMGC